MVISKQHELTSASVTGRKTVVASSSSVALVMVSPGLVRHDDYLKEAKRLNFWC